MAQDLFLPDSYAPIIIFISFIRRIGAFLRRNGAFPITFIPFLRKNDTEILKNTPFLSRNNAVQTLLIPF